jgi:hypothetical protein
MPRELIVKGKEPDDVSVSWRVAVVLTFTLPKETLAALALSAADAAFNSIRATSELPPSLAVRVTACALLTAETVATKLALAEPCATVTAAGTVTALLLLANAMVKPPLPVAPLKVTVQESVPAPVNAPLAQLNPLSTEGLVIVPVPLRFTTVEGAVAESLLRVSWPAAGPAAGGINLTLNAAFWPGGKVNGNVAPEIEKPLPLTVAALTVTASVPDDASVNGCAAAEFTATFPNDRLVVLTLNPGVTASNCSKKVSETPFAFAERVTVSGELTATAVAAKLALLAPAAMVTDAGTLTAALLLASVTVSPPLAAAALNVTVQLSAAAPVTALLAQLSALTPGALTAAPVPLRLTVIVPSAGALLVIVSCPAVNPVTVGEKSTARWNVPPAATVKGMSVASFTENAWPETLIFDTWTGADVWLISATLETEVCPIGTEPKETTPGDAWNGPFAELEPTIAPLVHPAMKIGRQSNAARTAIAVCRRLGLPVPKRSLLSQRFGREIWPTDSLIAMKLWINFSQYFISYERIKAKNPQIFGALEPAVPERVGTNLLNGVPIPVDGNVHPINWASRVSSDTTTPPCRELENLNVCYGCSTRGREFPLSRAWPVIEAVDFSEEEDMRLPKR